MTAKLCREFDLAALVAAWPAPSPLQKIPGRLMRRLDRLIEAADARGKPHFATCSKPAEVSL